MKIFYISNFPLDGALSPSINEIGFVNSLNNTFGKDCCYFICKSANDCDLPKNKLVFFKHISITSPLRFICYSIYWAIKASWLANKNKSDIIVIRTERAPLKEILLTYFTSKKVVLKSSSKYWMDQAHLNFIDAVFKKIDFFLYQWLHKIVDGIECVTNEYRQFHIANRIDEKKAVYLFRENV